MQHTLQIEDLKVGKKVHFQKVDCIKIASKNQTSLAQTGGKPETF